MLAMERKIHLMNGASKEESGSFSYFHETYNLMKHISSMSCELRLALKHLMSLENNPIH